MQSAVAELKELIDNQSSTTNVNEGAGTVRTYSNQWGLPSYGSAVEYVHLMNPNPPKVLLHLYGGENTGFASSNNLIVSNSYSPNSYYEANGVEGDDTMTVADAGAFNQGDHILIHQTVGDGNGKWNSTVQAINGNSLAARPPHTTTSPIAIVASMNRAQVVIASYNTFEVVNGDEVYLLSRNRDNQ